MPAIGSMYGRPAELLLGRSLNTRVPNADQVRQGHEVLEILRRLRNQPGVVLADEVGMGKTFVALAVAYAVAARSPLGPVVLMVPANLVDKWVQDLKTFCELYLAGRTPVLKQGADGKTLRSATALRYGVARDSVDFMKLLDDPTRERCHLVFLAQGALSRRQTDKWVRLALIAEALRRHGRGKAARLILVKKQIHRFLAQLLWAVGEERAQELGEALWQDLLHADPTTWKHTFNKGIHKASRLLDDDPVPKAVVRTLRHIDLKPLARALESMPVRVKGDDQRMTERLNVARRALSAVEKDLWTRLLAQARWRSPLLVMDEAHHLKNPGTALARQFQTTETAHDLKTGDGAMASAFDRMLFLTATPFQLGHHELVSVLERFGDVRWNTGELGERDAFMRGLSDLRARLTESQRAAIALQRGWSRLRPEDVDDDREAWWKRLLGSSRDALTPHQRAVVDAYSNALKCRERAECALRPWIVRHNKGRLWEGTDILRRSRYPGKAIADHATESGLPIPPDQLLPFFLAARSAVGSAKDLLGEALSSSYEAFRFTRQGSSALKDEQEAPEEAGALHHARWYLGEFDAALADCTGANHPKTSATVRRVVDLWEQGEKVLVFAFYRRTCAALRKHISDEIERRMLGVAQNKLRAADSSATSAAVERLVERVQKRYFDDTRLPGRRALDAALESIIARHAELIVAAEMGTDQRDALVDVMRRFLRVPTTLVCCFPLAQLDSLGPTQAVDELLAHADASELSWKQKFEGFIRFLTTQCSTEERRQYLEAAQRTQTGAIRVQTGDDEAEAGDSSTVAVANVQVITGDTRRDARARLMRAFNTPFFPDILVCSEVMGEGVDLQRSCRHVIHHDMAWNPSTIEQRTGRIDRLGCKAEGRHPVVLYLPYLSGAADERQYQVMSEREQWFRVVMGQDEVAKLITPDSSSAVPLPDAVAEGLSFRLGLRPSESRPIGPLESQ